MEQSDTRAIDENFAHWLAKVESLVGHKVDPVQALTAFACLEPPYKALTPEEYAAELNKRRAAVANMVAHAQRHKLP